MKKVFYFLLFILFSANAFASYQYGPRPCEMTEQALWTEMSNVGQAQTIDDHVKIARIYRAMATRGCPSNASAYKQYSYASLDAARALVYVGDLSGSQKTHYESMIKRATGF